jgi:erythromycin esterase-like protein
MITQRHHHTGGFGMAFGLPIADAIEQITTSARVLDASSEKVSRERQQDFGSQIAQAVRRKTRRPAATAVRGAAPGKDDDDDDDETEEEKQKDADNDSFAELLKKAVRRKSRQRK